MEIKKLLYATDFEEPDFAGDRVEKRLPEAVLIEMSDMGKRV